MNVVACTGDKNTRDLFEVIYIFEDYLPSSGLNPCNLFFHKSLLLLLLLFLLLLLLFILLLLLFILLLLLFLCFNN